MEKIRLADMIELVADELLHAEQIRIKRGHVMQFEECELEMTVEAEIQEGGKLKIWVLELGSENKRTNSNKIKVKFKKLNDTIIEFLVTDDNEPGPPLGRASETK